MAELTDLYYMSVVEVLQFELWIHIILFSTNMHLDVCIIFPAASAMISGMDTTDEQFVSITDPTTNQEIMVPVSQANLGPFESLLVATEAADQPEENTGEGENHFNLPKLII